MTEKTLYDYEIYRDDDYPQYAYVITKNGKEIEESEYDYDSWGSSMFAANDRITLLEQSL